MKIETEFTGLPLSKLESLLNNGWKVNGVHIQSVQMDGTLKHGAVTTGGMVLWWHPEQKRVIAPSVRSVAQQTLDALEKFGRGESSGISMTVLVHNLREALAAPNSVEFDGIETQPAHRAPVATFDEVFDAIDWDVWRMQPIRELVRMIHGKTAPQPATQQAPDALHLAAMDLARKQMDRIADLEAEVARFRTDAMNEKAARQALEQQLAARVPLTDGEWFKFWGNCDEIPGDSVYPEFLELARIVEAYYGIQKDPA